MHYKSKAKIILKWYNGVATNASPGLPAVVFNEGGNYNDSIFSASQIYL